MIDDDLKPWLIEVNHAPSLHIETDFDQKLKTDLITDTFKLINMSVKSKNEQLENLSK